MSKVTCNLTITADGYSAGHNQTEKRPFGDDGGDGWGDRLHAWAFDDRAENQTEAGQLADAQAFIMGRNMFGPVRGEWDRQWNGWWGDDPPYHPRSSCSPTTRATRSRWTAAPRSTSSPTVSSRRRRRRATLPETAMSRSMAARAPSTSISPRA